MKKILSLALTLVLVLSLFALVGCGAKTGDKDVADTLKFGMGSYSYIDKATSADADTNGNGEYVTTVAAVLLDNDGKIVDAVIDSTDNTVEYTSQGKVVAPAEFKTKYELGDDYGMKKYGAKKEWFEQVDAFVATVKGKTASEVKALVADGGKGNDDVVSAGCTIVVADFVKALEKAVSNAKASDATKDAKLKLGIVSSVADSKDAADDAKGVLEIATTFVATATDKNDKVIIADTDALTVKFTFDTKGASDVDTTTEIKTKCELGDDYGMKKYGAKKEWFEQVDAFNKECVGKTADDISKLAANDGKAGDALTTAGCTINVADMVKAAVKAVK